MCRLNYIIWYIQNWDAATSYLGIYLQGTCILCTEAQLLFSMDAVNVNQCLISNIRKVKIAIRFSTNSELFSLGANFPELHASQENLF